MDPTQQLIDALQNAFNQHCEAQGAYFGHYTDFGREAQGDLAPSFARSIRHMHTARNIRVWARDNLNAELDTKQGTKAYDNGKDNSDGIFVRGHPMDKPLLIKGLTVENHPLIKPAMDAWYQHLHNTLSAGDIEQDLHQTTSDVPWRDVLRARWANPQDESRPENQAKLKEQYGGTMHDDTPFSKSEDETQPHPHQKVHHHLEAAKHHLTLAEHLHHVGLHDDAKRHDQAHAKHSMIIKRHLQSDSPDGVSTIVHEYHKSPLHKEHEEKYNAKDPSHRGDHEMDSYLEEDGSCSHCR